MLQSPPNSRPLSFLDPVDLQPLRQRFDLLALTLDLALQPLGSFGPLNQFGVRRVTVYFGTDLLTTSLSSLRLPSSPIRLARMGRRCPLGAANLVLRVRPLDHHRIMPSVADDLDLRVTVFQDRPDWRELWF